MLHKRERERLPYSIESNILKISRFHNQNNRPSQSHSIKIKHQVMQMF